MSRNRIYQAERHCRMMIVGSRQSKMVHYASADHCPVDVAVVAAADAAAADAAAADAAAADAAAADLLESVQSEGELFLILCYPQNLARFRQAKLNSEAIWKTTLLINVKMLNEICKGY